MTLSGTRRASACHYHSEARSVYGLRRWKCGHVKPAKETACGEGDQPAGNIGSVSMSGTQSDHHAPCFEGNLVEQLRISMHPSIPPKQGSSGRNTQAFNWG
jgi:hypothetical protein